MDQQSGSQNPRSTGFQQTASSSGILKHSPEHSRAHYLEHSRAHYLEHSRAHYLEHSLSRFVSILLIPLLLGACIPGAGQLKLYPTMDNFWTPGPNAGGSSYDCNAVGHGPEQNLVMIGEIYWENYCSNIVGLKFDLSQVPEGAEILSARLFMYLESAEGDTEAQVASGVAPGFWEEDTETWGAGLLYCLDDPFAVTELGHKPGWKSWNVASVVQKLVADPASNEGICLKRLDREYGWRIFSSREGKTDQRPYLEVRYSSAP